LTAYESALALNPNLAEAWYGSGVALAQSNRLKEALSALDTALSLKPNFPEAISDRIYVLDFTVDAGFQEQQKARDDWWKAIAPGIAERLRAPHSNNRDPGRRLKLGYVSGDFRRHSAAFCFRPLLLNHDKTQFDITCYSTSLLEDDYTEDFRRGSDRWRNVVQSTDDELYKQIQTDQIDILIDLSGHTLGNRLDVFARKPAPVQISEGATGTGLPMIDYLTSNPVVIPQAVRHMFAEKIVDLPAVMTIEPLPDQLGPSDPPVLSRGYITFGVFNRVGKISDEVISHWARILHAVPLSRILLKHLELDDVSTRDRLSGQFALHGIAAERVAFLGATGRSDHLTAFKDIDISLDPFPYNGGISTLESLQMGVPVVAKLGNSVSSRSAGAILSSVGMGDWVADSVEDYQAIAVRFASMPDRLKILRYELPARVSASAAGNPLTYTRAIEAVYRKTWADYCRTAVVQSGAS
jgi:predicted O-linked N-acetylglucosamine transferase (SPINDLY family)